MKHPGERLTLTDQLAFPSCASDLRDCFVAGVPAGWLEVAAHDLGEFRSQGELLSASLNCVQPLVLQCGRTADCVRLDQRNYHNGHLCGGFRSAWDQCREAAQRINAKQEWTKGHLVLGPTVFHRGAGTIHVRDQSNGELQPRMAERLFLPPIESFAVLESTGFDDKPYSWLGVVWYGVAYGMSMSSIPQIFR